MVIRLLPVAIKSAMCPADPTGDREGWTGKAGPGRELTLLVVLKCQLHNHPSYRILFFCSVTFDLVNSSVIKRGGLPCSAHNYSFHDGDQGLSPSGVSKECFTNNVVYEVNGKLVKYRDKGNNVGSPRRDVWGLMTAPLWGRIHQ